MIEYSGLIVPKLKRRAGISSPKLTRLTDPLKSTYIGNSILLELKKDLDSELYNFKIRWDFWEWACSMLQKALIYFSNFKRLNLNPKF
jgi:hypothetical protein